jgi:hypothetical protein
MPIITIEVGGDDDVHAESSDERDQFIPVRKTDILNVLTAQGTLGTEADKFQHLCRLLGSVFHYGYFDQLERLREAYFYFNPELDPHVRFDAAALERAYGELVQDFVAVLHRANFVEVSQAEIERAHRENALVRVELHTPVEEFREVRFFRRGRHKERVEIPSTWLPWRKTEQEIEVFDDLVLFVAMKPHDGPPPPKPARRRHGPGKTRPGAVLIKYFRHIPSADLNALYPHVQVVMGWKDMLIMAVPALLGGVPIVLKLFPTMAVLFLVLGFYLGVSGTVQDNDLKQALGALSGIVALGAFLFRQWTKYHRRSLQHQKELTDNVYFRNINNNAGIFDYVIGAAEDQECKEAFLAYYVLHTAKEPLTQGVLDRRIESWLQESFGVELNFEVEDALTKLDGLKLLQRRGDRLSVLPLDDALGRLDSIWDDFFRFERAVPAPRPAPEQFALFRANGAGP